MRVKEKERASERARVRETRRTGEERTGERRRARFQIELEEEGGTENGRRRESEIRIPCMVGGAYIGQ